MSGEKTNTNYFQKGHIFFPNFKQLTNAAKLLPHCVETIEFIKCLEATKEQGYELLKPEFKLDGKNDLPPIGFVRIFGAESEAERNELVKFEEIDNRIKEILDLENQGENTYYNSLKFIWLRYDDGREEQMADRAWSKPE